MIVSSPPPVAKVSPPPTGAAPVQKTVAPAPVQVAFLTPLSGSAAATGRALLNAAQMAMFDLADDRFTLLPMDTRGTPDGAAQAARQAVGEGAQLILGPLFAGSVRAVADIARPAHVPVISHSTDPSVASPGLYVSGILLRDQATRLITESLRRGLSRFALLSPDTAYGRSMASVFADAVSEHAPQATLTTWDTYDPADSTQISAAAQRLLPHEDEPSRFDVLMIPQSGQTLKEVLAILAYAGLDPTRSNVVGPMVWDDPTLFTEPLLNGAWYPAPASSQRGEFLQRYQALYGHPAPSIASLGYDTAALAIVLARSSQTKGTPYTSAALTNPNGFVGVDGIFRLHKNGLSEHGLAVMEITHGTRQQIGDAPRSFVVPHTAVD